MLETACRSFFLGKKEIIAHRGAPLHVVENTLQSFQSAVAQGASIIELDVQRTRDGKLIVFHDSSVDRVTSGSGLIRNFTWKDVQRFKLRGSVTVPLLRDVLQAMPPYVRFVVEIKNIPESVPHVMRMLERTGTMDRALVCSFFPRVLELVRQHSTTIPVAVLSWYVSESVLKLAKVARAEAIHTYHWWLTKSKVSEVHERGCKVIAWTPNTQWRMRTLFGWGVDGVITNNVGRALRASRYLESADQAFATENSIDINYRSG